MLNVEGFFVGISRIHSEMEMQYLKICRILPNALEIPKRVRKRSVPRNTAQVKALAGGEAGEEGGRLAWPGAAAR